MNIWILTNSPSPYQVEFFSAIATSGRCTLHVRFMERLHNGEDPLSDHPQAFSYRILKPGWRAGSRQELRFQPDALHELNDSSYDVFILSGLYTSPTFLACAQRLRSLKRPWLIWLEPPWPDDYSPPWATRLSTSRPWIRSIRNKLLCRLLTSADRTLCIGSAAVRAYSSLGADPGRLVNLPYHCDTSRFRPKDRREAVRHCLHVDDHTVFLFSGSLIPRKGCDILVSVFLKIAEEHPTCSLLLLGSGSSQSDLESMVPDAMKSRIRFLGHRAQAEIPDVYQAADVFVFPSRHDGWGVVLNEAAPAGLPMIATETTGAALDLIDPGRNGFRIARDDSDALYQSMKHFLIQPGAIAEMGAESRRISERYSLSAGTTKLCDTLDTVLSHTRSR